MEIISDLIILGVIGIIISATITKHKFKQSGLPSELLEHTAGTGLVPKWVSFINVISWIILGIGVLLLFSQ